MIERLTVLQETRSRGVSGSTFTDWFDVGADPNTAAADDDLGGDTAKVDEEAQVEIDRTPNTEERVTVSSRVRWRDQVWIVKGRSENRRRTKYELTLERTQWRQS